MRKHAANNTIPQEIVMRIKGGKHQARIPY